MPNGDEGRAEFERLQEAKVALKKMHEADDAQSVEDAKRFNEEQKAWALKQATDFMEKMFPQGYPLRATEDAAMQDSFGNPVNAVSRNSKTLMERARAGHSAGVITPRQHSRGPLRTLPELAGTEQKIVDKPAQGSDGFPGGLADEVDYEGGDFEYACRDGKNLDEKAEQLSKSRMLADIGGLNNVAAPEYEASQPEVRRADDTGWEAPRSAMEAKHIAGPGPCVRDGFPTGPGPELPDYGKDIPWGDPNAWPSPPTPLPNVLSEEDREKLKDTIEQMGQGKEGGGFRMNAGKNQIELLPEIWLWAVADVMTQGARKYPARNWEKGMDWSAMVGCMYRHLAKFQSGQRYDGLEFNKKLGTTGCHELAMVAWNALALMFYDLYGLGNNDLPVYEDLDHFIRVNGSSSDLAVRWAGGENDDGKD